MVNASLRELFILSVIAYSLAFGYIESPLMGWLRNVISKIHPHLTQCYHCVGFWVSLSLALFLFRERGIVTVVLSALFSCGLVILYNKVESVLWCLKKRLEDGEDNTV